jgi:hypothetical protein
VKSRKQKINNRDEWALAVKFHSFLEGSRAKGKTSKYSNIDSIKLVACYDASLKFIERPSGIS